MKPTPPPQQTHDARINILIDSLAYSYYIVPQCKLYYIIIIIIIMYFEQIIQYYNIMPFMCAEITRRRLSARARTHTQTIHAHIIIIMEKKKGRKSEDIYIYARVSNK